MTHLTEELAYWINERYAIKERREAGEPRPWSGDGVFQTVRFCNVHREDDAVTKWIRQNWNRAGDPAWKFVLGRMLNLPESLDAIKDLTNLDDMKAILKLRRDRGEKIFTSAYTISTCGRKMDKLDYVFDHVVAAVKESDDQQFPPNYDTLGKCASDLICIDGLGSFLAAQVVADMKNTEGHPLSNAPDWWTWAAPGPGSLRGLSWYFYGKPEGVTVGKFDAALSTCMAEVLPHVHPSVPRISEQDFQNCLCEFSKYMKVKADSNAHVRNKFQGR